MYFLLALINRGFILQGLVRSQCVFSPVAVSRRFLRKVNCLAVKRRGLTSDKASVPHLHLHGIFTMSRVSGYSAVVSFMRAVMNSYVAKSS
jgi:hypothetical protein